MSLNETQNKDFSFTEEENEKIHLLTKEYQVIMREALRVQAAIDDASRELVLVVEKAEQIKNEEIDFFEKMSIKYDLETKTLQTIAANKILNNGI